MLGTARAGEFDRDIFERRIKFGKRPRAEIQNVPGQAAGSRAGLNHDERARRAQQLPHFRKLAREEASENRMHVNARVIVPKSPAAFVRADSSREPDGGTDTHA